MNKDFTQQKLTEFDTDKQMRILLDLASYIEENSLAVDSKAFQKLTKYHSFLSDNSDENIQKLNKEFVKIKAIDFQFQIYLMNLERLLGQTSKEYQFLIQQNDFSSTTQKKFNIVCILDSVRSAHNVGAMIRTSECFGIEKFYTCGLSPKADSLHVQKTAMGSEKLVKSEHVNDLSELINELKKKGYQIWSIETSRSDRDLNDIDSAPEKLALIFGHEQFGVSASALGQSDKIVPLKLHGSKNSLNVSIAHGIVLNKITQLLEES